MNVNLLHRTRNCTSLAPNFGVDVPRLDLERTVYLREFGRIRLRPIRPEDEARMIDFHQNLSEESVYLRYFERLPLETRIMHERLAKVCANSAETLALIAEMHATASHPAQIVAVGRLTTTEIPTEAAFALVMSDKARATDLPREILKALMAVAHACGFHALIGELLIPDREAQTLCRSLGFKLSPIPDNGLVQLRCDLMRGSE